MAQGCAAPAFSVLGSEHGDSSTSLGYLMYLQEDTLSCPLKASTQTQLQKARSGLKDRATESEEGGLTWGCLDGDLHSWVLRRLLFALLLPWPCPLPCLLTAVLPGACGFPRSLTPYRAPSSHPGRRRQGPGSFGLVCLGPTYPCHCLP